MEYETDLKAIQKFSSKPKDLLSIIEFLGALIFIYIFVLIPAGLYFEQTFYLKFLIIATTSVYILEIFLSSWFLQDRIKLSIDSIGMLIHLLFFPVSVIHVAQNLARLVFASSDWVAISAAFLSRDDFRKVIRKELKRLHFSKVKCKDNELFECLKLKREYLHRFLPIAGLAIEDLFEHPVKQDINAAVYCPLCEVEFVEGIDLCPDCNMNLARFSQ